MRLLSLKEFPDYKPDVEFKSPWLDRLLVTIVVVMAGIALLIAPHYPIFGKKLPAWWCYLAGALLGLMRLLYLSAFRKSLRPTNWLLRSSGNRIWIKFRSFLNDHLPIDETQIIEIERNEVAWVRQSGIKMVFLASGGKAGWTTRLQTMKCLDIGLTQRDTDLLDAQLRMEEQHPGAGKYGIRSKSGHYPVSVPMPGVIRVLWSDPNGRIKPSSDQAIEFFARWARIEPLQLLTIDCTPKAIAELTEPEQRLRLRDLNRINGSSAIHVVQELRKCSLANAMAHLKEI